ncbi:histidine phosphatase family protein [Umezakia ovalisporum]|jgi:probable phosphoglycerate mutase|uniref:Histidine phosphatase family protein n=1 Tax=Umezakia ovalisporum FSS-43 TaxID=2740520 RepID=A0ABT6K6W1_9CYAN|nr:histidine phosphatase family protein [Umezakia ovalisporum]MDH6058111.1 histidine phosphatase family protein [Umezakia ovalisporum FSS-43]MDH6066645.1 histidine phosphatase family protein [Umezakia ovalisporum APH033B]MDH6071602.1 histidine phosphatase family protein [Umezakia ovalisporum CobakiLakeA]MDH6073036.1 histidine phosphatase family protein [Umezakia ovalisporum CS-1034]MDH6078254.1 histidine phosphatase family protein [Umezakia ovalisporum FSS-45]
MTRVIIVRHGQSSYNTERRIQGRTDVSVLTEKGCEDASKVGKALGNIVFSAIYSSPLQRAKKTAEIISNELANQLVNESSHPLQPQICHGLTEIDLPLWAEMLSADVKEKFTQDYRIWKECPHELKMLVNDAEGTREHFPVLAIYEQARLFWQEILPLHQKETILIVAHNGINRALISTALGIPPSRYHCLQQSNCGISVLNFAGGLGEPVQLESMNQTQHLGETFPSVRPNHQGVRLLLVRHGETEWNRQTRFQGQIDIPLNDNGRKQAQTAGEFLRNVFIDFAVSSSMLRPKETAELILSHHPQVKLELQDGLREISHGLWEGKLETEIEEEFPGELQRWRVVPAEVQMPQGENLQQVWERSVSTWQLIVEAALNNELKTGLIVAHDATNKTLLCHVLGLSTKNFWNFRQGNGAVSVIDYPSGLNGLPVLQAMNITGHLSGGVLDKTAAGAL